MENRINIAELLKACPQGMELNCTMFNKVTLFTVDDREGVVFPITVFREDGNPIVLTKYGQYIDADFAKCVIFPKGKTTWEGFVPPCGFKDGDIIADEHGNIAIYKGTMWYNKKLAGYYCGYRKSDERFLPEPKRDGHFGLIDELLHATEEEKEKLFRVIIDNGYRWNTETKKLEKIEPNFKVGDWVTDGVSTCQIHSIDDTRYWYSENCILGSIESVDKRYHLWTINDAKDGNVIFYDNGWTCIFKNIHGIWYSSYCFITDDGEFHTGYERHAIDSTINGNAHPATEEQCNLLFQKMKEAGYAWYSKKKILEEIFPYNIGTKVWVKSDKEHKYIHTIVGISYNCFGNLEYEIKEEKTGIVVHYPKELLIPITTKEPKFKAGDRVKQIGSPRSYIIQSVEFDRYILHNNQFVKFRDEHIYELVPNKFDINTLKPFDEVLVRNTNNGRWRGQFYMSYNKNEEYPFECVYNCWKQCIPYEGNEHLHDKTDDCPDFYKTWQ